MTTSYAASPAGNGAVIRSDGASIPADPANRDYVEYLAWVAAGNTAAPIPPPPVSPNLSPYEFLELFTPSEQLAIQTVCNSNMTILLGLTTGIASGNVVLTSPSVISWIGALVAAGAITQARATAILAS